MPKGKKIVCFSANRTCHHDDYFLLFSKFIGLNNVKSSFPKLKILFSRDKIIFLDIDYADLIFFPIILLRGIWGGKGIAISVRTEYFYEHKSIKKCFFKSSTIKFFKSFIKKSLFFFIKNFSTTTIVSIHKNTPYQKDIEKFVNAFMFDPQLWDLPYLNIQSDMPRELSETFFNQAGKLILVPGRFNEQRSRTELLNFLNTGNYNNLNFLFAGEMSSSDFFHISNLPNCFVINRYVSNEELFYLMNNCDFIYSFYTNNRPSGFFGRAIQLRKPIIVRENSFLHLQFFDYPNLISVFDLSELDSAVHSFSKSDIFLNKYNDDFAFLSLINGL